MSSDIDLVLFDLGGVLVELAGVQTMLALTSIGGEDELWHRWLTCPWVRQFESGGCSEIDFAEGLVADWDLDVIPGAFLDRFREWPTGPLPGAEQLVIEVKSAVPIGCLSNTNALHWHERSSQWPLMGHFDHRFLSFEMGLLKPDVAAFRHVVDVLGLPPERVLFLDDNAANVDGAASVGFRAERAIGVEEARGRLAEAGILRSAV